MSDPVLVTGCDGFIGRHLCSRLRSLGIDFVGMDRVAFPFPKKVSHVYHLAGVSSIAAGERDPDACLNSHIGSYCVLMGLFDPKLITVAGSYLEYTDDDSVYVRAKRLASSAAIANGSRVVRLANVFGAGGHGIVDKWLSGGPRVVWTYGGKCSQLNFVHVNHAVQCLLDGVNAYGIWTSMFDIAEAFGPFTTECGPVINTPFMCGGGLNVFDYIKDRLHERS